MAKISTVKVPAEGERSARVMCVGEAPGGYETKWGRPFVGPSGSLLRNYLQRNKLQAGGTQPGMYSKDVWLTNLCKYQPPYNKFEALLKTYQLGQGLAELRKEIEEVQPNVILALGAWPLYMLTGKTNDKGEAGSGILNWRGSILPCTLARGKVVASVHPAFILQGSHRFLPIFDHDIARAVEEAGSPDYSPPTWDLFIDPEAGLLEIIAKEMLSAELLAMDFETFGDKMACLGIADSPGRCLVITHQSPHLHDVARQLFESSIPKAFHYGCYDINWARTFLRWRVGGYVVGGERIGWDTYVASASLLPEFRRTLAFLTSIYTRIPYYKEERKIWKETTDYQRLYRYNATDCIATYIIARTQMGEIRDLFPDEGQAEAA